MTKSRPNQFEMVAALLAAGIGIPNPQDAAFIRSQYELLCGSPAAGSESPGSASVSSSAAASSADSTPATAVDPSTAPSSVPVSAPASVRITTPVPIPSATIVDRPSERPVSRGAIPKQRTTQAPPTKTTSSIIAPIAQPVPVPTSAVDFLPNMGRVIPNDQPDYAAELTQLEARERVLQLRIRV